MNSFSFGIGSVNSTKVKNTFCAARRQQYPFRASTRFEGWFQIFPKTKSNPNPDFMQIKKALQILFVGILKSSKIYAKFNFFLEILFFLSAQWQFKFTSTDLPTKQMFKTDTIAKLNFIAKRLHKIFAEKFSFVPFVFRI